MTFEERIEKYLEEEKDDFFIDKTKLLLYIQKMPNLHSKWLRYFTNEKALWLKMEKHRRKLFRDLHEYYLTEYSFSIKPNQVHYYIESDKKYNDILYKIEMQEHIIKTLETILNKIKNVSWDIKNYIEWSKFVNGET